MLTCSGLTGDGVAEVWSAVGRHRTALGPNGLPDKRSAQRLELTWSLVRDELDQRLRHSAAVAAIRDDIRRAVLAGTLGPVAAADRILAALDSQP